MNPDVIVSLSFLWIVITVQTAGSACQWKRQDTSTCFQASQLAENATNLQTALPIACMEECQRSNCDLMAFYRNWLWGDRDMQLLCFVSDTSAQSECFCGNASFDLLRNPDPGATPFTACTPPCARVQYQHILGLPGCFYPAGREFKAQGFDYFCSSHGPYVRVNNQQVCLVSFLVKETVQRPEFAKQWKTWSSDENCVTHSFENLQILRRSSLSAHQI